MTILAEKSNSLRGKKKVRDPTKPERGKVTNEAGSTI
jgi:hypothetical protein